MWTAMEETQSTSFASDFLFYPHSARVFQAQILTTYNYVPLLV